MNVPNGFELAITASGMTKKEAMAKLGFSNYYALITRLEDPLQFRLSEIIRLTEDMPTQAKKLIKEELDKIFFAQGLE